MPVGCKLQTCVHAVQSSDAHVAMTRVRAQSSNASSSSSRPISPSLAFLHFTPKLRTQLNMSNNPFPLNPTSTPLTTSDFGSSALSGAPVDSSLATKEPQPTNPLGTSEKTPTPGQSLDKAVYAATQTVDPKPAGERNEAEQHVGNISSGIAGVRSRVASARLILPLSDPSFTPSCRPSPPPPSLPSRRCLPSSPTSSPPLDPLSKLKLLSSLATP